jgi:hypothetical protein
MQFGQGQGDEVGFNVDNRNPDDVSVAPISDITGLAPHSPNNVNRSGLSGVSNITENLNRRNNNYLNEIKKEEEEIEQRKRALQHKKEAQVNTAKQLEVRKIIQATKQKITQMTLEHDGVLNNINGVPQSNLPAQNNDSNELIKDCLDSVQNIKTQEEANVILNRLRSKFITIQDNAKFLLENINNPNLVNMHQENARLQEELEATRRGLQEAQRGLEEERAGRLERVLQMVEVLRMVDQNNMPAPVNLNEVQIRPAQPQPNDTGCLSYLKNCCKKAPSQQQQQPPQQVDITNMVGGQQANIAQEVRNSNVQSVVTFGLNSLQGNNL